MTRRETIGSLLGFALGAALVLLWPGRGEAPSPDARARDGSATSGEASSPETSAELAQLRAELARERETSEGLRAELDALAAGASAGSLVRADADAADGAADDDPHAGLGTGDADLDDAIGRDGEADVRRAQPWFDAALLEEAGYPPGEVERVQEAFERTAMLRLELEDARTRAGEHGLRPVMRDELAVERRMRSELGDETYDAMLYASNESNRVILTELIDEAPGAAAGLAPGDEVISYDGQRIFHPRDLKRLTGAGERGEQIEVRVRRDDEVVRVFLPRGPIGARLGVDSRPPRP